MAVTDQLKQIKAASYGLALLSEQQRNQVLQSVASKLRSSVSRVLNANAKDLATMDQNDPMYDRLLLTAERINGIAKEIETVIALESPINKLIDSRVMPNKLLIEKFCVPLGVVAVIYESRPNVTIDVFTLCFKAGNACVLKGGKEALHSNSILVEIIQQVLQEHGVDQDAIYLMPPNREDTHVLLQAIGLIDVCIPRGSQELINFVRENAKIPIIETGAGIVHTYFDASGDLAKGCAIINNAKTRRVSVCNALDCLIMHRDRLNDLPALVAQLQKHAVEIYADELAFAAVQSHYPQPLLKHATAADYGREFLAYKLAIKTVDSVDAAIQHIMHYSSGHSEAIIAEDADVANYFVQRIDVAAVYINTSTAFTDGAQFGLGAEIGISTQKLHARGPMGLAALTSYKWVVHGNGQIRP